MALHHPLHIPQLSRTLAYWRVAHTVMDRASNKLHIHLWGYEDHAARDANQPAHVMRWEIPRDSLQDFNAMHMTQLYGLVKAGPPLPNLPWENYSASPFVEAQEV